MRLQTDGQAGADVAAALSDDAIVSRVLQGDLAAFELIMRRYNQRLFRIIRPIVSDDDEAEDVLQETYLRAYEHLAQFEHRARFSTWVTRIAVHEASARRSRRQRMRMLSDGAADAWPSDARHSHAGESEASMRELRDVITREMEALPQELCVVFTMRMIEGMDTDETAACLGLSPSNVRVRLHRARTLLQSRIDDRIGSEVRRLYQFDGERCDRIVRLVLTRLSSGT